MIVAEGGKMVEYKDHQLKLYTFNANLNPIYNISETELTTVKIPAPNEEHAWNRLEWLLGSKSKVNNFRIDDIEPY